MGRTSALFDPMLAQVGIYKMTQSSTSAPAVGGTVHNGIAAFATFATIARGGAGVYTFTKTGAFTVGKTFVKVTSSNAGARVCTVTYTSADVFQLNFFDAATPTAADSGDFDLEIAIYN